MTRSEWLRHAARLNDLWPSRPMLPGTVAASFELLEALPDGAMRKAVESYFREGHEFMPSVSQLYALAVPYAASEHPALVADTGAPLTDEERERGRGYIRRILDGMAERERQRGPAA